MDCGISRLGPTLILFPQPGPDTKIVTERKVTISFIKNDESPTPTWDAKREWDAKTPKYIQT